MTTAATTEHAITSPQSQSHSATKLKSFDQDGVQFAWDSTSLKSAMTCLRYYQLKHIEGWRGKNKSVHLWFGGLYASALENYYKLQALGSTADEALHQVVKETLEETWHRFQLPNGDWRGGPVVFDDPNKTRETLIRTIIWYADQFQDDPARVMMLDNGKPAVELSFSLPVDNDVVFCGHLDRVVEYSGDYYVMDQKTTKATITTYFMSQWDTDTQMSMYTFAGKAILNAPVKGVIIDAAQIAVGFSRFERGFTHRTEAQLEEWYAHTLHHIKIARRATYDNFFPMNLTSCDKFGGCEFKSICARSPQVRQRFLEGDFERQPRWDPLERR